MTTREVRYTTIKKFLLIILISNILTCVLTTRPQTEDDNNDQDSSEVQTLSDTASNLELFGNDSLDMPDTTDTHTLSNLSQISATELDQILEESEHEFYSFPMKILLSTLATTTSLVTISGKFFVASCNSVV